MNPISYLSSKILTKGNIFANYLLFVDAYSKLPNFKERKHNYWGSHGQAKIFQIRFVKLDTFGWWYLEQIQTDAGT